MLEIENTALAGVQRITLTPFEDHRGAFDRLFCLRELQEVIGNRQIVQINHSCTATVGAIRGLHYQYPPVAEMKLIYCMRGKVWDVALDIRKNSSTYLHWVAEELTENKPILWVIPEGCAHGFQVLAPNSELLYLHTSFYRPEYEGGVRYNDPEIIINWPLPVSDISQRDQNHVLIDENYQGLTL